MFMCRLVISVQGVIIIDLSSLGCIVPEILKRIKKHLYGRSIGCFDFSFLIFSQLFRLMVFLFLPVTAVFSICGGFSWTRDRSGGGETADGEEAARGGESARG